MHNVQKSFSKKPSLPTPPQKNLKYKSDDFT